MRVIAGTARGRRLKAPARERRSAAATTVRPTSDLMRGAIFSALASLGADMARVLDVYAGSGALGIEALSRGAGWCDFVESDPATCALIRENLRLTGFEDRARVYCLAVERANARLREPYTLILADPPYADREAVAALEALCSSGLVQPRVTVLVLEHSAREEPGASIGPLELVNSRRHGDSAVSIYR